MRDLMCCFLCPGRFQLGGEATWLLRSLLSDYGDHNPEYLGLKSKGFWWVGSRNH